MVFIEAGSSALSILIRFSLFLIVAFSFLELEAKIAKINLAKVDVTVVSSLSPTFLWQGRPVGP